MLIFKRNKANKQMEDILLDADKYNRFCNSILYTYEKLLKESKEGELCECT
jgi:hypothetical protein